jgi:O-antigen/teichoic acid export membrane protein
MGGYGANQAIRLASNLVLTRVLFPEAFGLMAIVNAVLGGLAMFSDLGLSASIVQNRRGDDPAFLDTAWTLQILRGLVLFGLAAAAALPLAAFYEQPQLAQLIAAAALSVLITGFNSTALPRLQRHLALKQIVILELAAQIVAVVVMISWALLRPTVWALVGGALVSSAIKMGGSHYVGRHRPDRLRWEKDAARALFAFGKWIFFSTILAFLVGQADRLIFGKLVSMQELGVYSIAAMLSMSAALLTNQIGTSVIFPAFSRTREDRTAFRQVYARSKRSLNALSGFVLIVLVSSGVPLVEILYDERYAGAGLFLQILALGAWFGVLEVPPGSAVLAWGKPRWLAAANASKLVGILVLVPLGFWAAGFVGAIVGFVAAEVLRYGMVTAVAQWNGARALGIDLCSTAGFALAAATGMQLAHVVGADAGAVERFAVSAATAMAVWSPAAAALAWTELGPLLRSMTGRLFKFSSHQRPG